MIFVLAPFNGWFVSIEVARNLLDRYEATMPLAKAMGIDPSDKFVAQKVSTELESAILYSFEKNEFTMVDPMTVGKSFMTHCKREQSAGRECPAQWSWIGGLVGEILLLCLSFFIAHSLISDHFIYYLPQDLRILHGILK